MLPLFLLLKELGLVNTYAGVLVPGLASIFGIFLVRQYVPGIPDALLDAARVDGAGELRIFTSVVLPLCRPMLVTLATFTFLGAWNDFLWPLVVLGDERLQPLPVALANLLGEHAQDVELLMAGSVLTVLPVVVLFVALQRYYLQGILTGSLRGVRRWLAASRCCCSRAARCWRAARSERSGSQRRAKRSRAARLVPAQLARRAALLDGGRRARRRARGAALRGRRVRGSRRRASRSSRSCSWTGTRVTARDAVAAQSLEEGDLPIPSVRWEHPRARLRVRAFAAGRRAPPFASYRVENPRAEPRAVELWLALRPMQVLPTWQFLNLQPGFAPIRDISPRGRSGVA